MSGEENPLCSSLDIQEMEHYGSHMTSRPTPDTIGGRLTQLRKEREWTRQDVYDRLRDRFGKGVPVPTLEKWENDRNEPTATQLARLAILYNVSLDYVFMASDEPGGPDAPVPAEPAPDPQDLGGGPSSPPPPRRGRRPGNGSNRRRA